MPIQFPSAFVLSDSRWTTFKTTVNLKVLSMQYEVDNDGNYFIYAIDDPVVYRTYIWTGLIPPPVPSDYNQAQNDADKAEFETNYKDVINGQIFATNYDPRRIHKFGNLTSTAVPEVLVATRPYAEPAAQAQRSVVSTNAGDTQDVRITYLDNNYVLKTEDKTLTGLIAVNTVATDIRFIEKFQIIRGTAAVGAIRLMTLIGGGGTEICGIAAATENAFLCHHYIPAGKRAWILGWGATMDGGGATGNAAFKLKGQQRFGANLVDQNLDLENLFVATPPRSEFYRPFQAPPPIGEKCYVRVTVVPGQATSTIERAILDIWEDKA